MNYKQVLINCLIKKVTAFAFPAGTLQSIKNRNSKLSLLNNLLALVKCVACSQKFNGLFVFQQGFVKYLMSLFLCFFLWFYWYKNWDTHTRTHAHLLSSKWIHFLFSYIACYKDYNAILVYTLNAGIHWALLPDYCLSQFAVTLQVDRFHRKSHMSDLHRFF